jgi:enamine deaminase RidA (YjgF/YER057c/UK114 family)
MKRLLGACLAAGLCIPAALSLQAAPAAAAGGPITLTGSDGQPVADGGVVSVNDTLTISAQVGPSATETTLSLQAPDQTRQTAQPVARVGLTTGTTLRYQFQTSCYTETNGQAPASCTGYQPAINGVWTVLLSGGESAQYTFALRIPAEPVQGVQAAASGSTVSIGWQPNPERDVTAYDVLTGSGQPLVSGASPAAACDAQGCAVRFDLGAQAQGTWTFVVRADRATCPGCADTVAGAPSQPVSVTFASQPTSSPSGSPGPPSGDKRHRPAGGTRPGSTAALPPASYNLLAEGQSAQNLLPAPAAAAPPNLPQQQFAGGGQGGGFSPELAYPQQPMTAGAPARRHVTAGPRLRLVSGPVAEPLWRAGAGVLLLGLLAAHVIAWSRRRLTEPSGDRAA